MVQYRPTDCSLSGTLCPSNLICFCFCQRGSLRRCSDPPSQWPWFVYHICSASVHKKNTRRECFTNLSVFLIHSVRISSVSLKFFTKLISERKKTAAGHLTEKCNRKADVRHRESCFGADSGRKQCVYSLKETSH